MKNLGLFLHSGLSMICSKACQVYVDGNGLGTAGVVWICLGGSNCQFCLKKSSLWLSEFLGEEMPLSGRAGEIASQ